MSSERVTGRAPRLRRVASLVLVGMIATAAIAGCSTSGRELRATSSTMPPDIQAATTTEATAATPVEGLGGFALSSASFTPGGTLPGDSGAATGNRSPALAWTNTPESAAELTLLVTDETGGVIYWFVTGITTTDLEVAPGTVPEGGVEHATTAGPVGWNGPVVTEGGAVTLVFALYALNDPVVAQEGESSHALRERVIADSFATASLRATFVGTGASLQPG
jgi:phosphatidylethanolamine-binding protein (PEBP) family uncharacterized protein